MSKPKICVVGAGVSGLSTAYILLKEAQNKFDLTIVAEQFTPYTTSDVAFGLCSSDPYLIGETPLQKVKKWSRETLEHMGKLASSKDASKAGTFLISGHSIFKEKPEDPPWKNEAVHFRYLTDKELKFLYPGFRYGWSWTTGASECKFYLPYLMETIRELGGRFIKKKLTSLQELYGEYDVIVNCSGLGAKDLTSDKAVHPIRGQAIRVKAPWVKRFVMIDEINCYIIPGQETVILGGSHHEGDWNKEVSPAIRSRIHRDACKIMPSLRNAEIVGDYVGLRPGRSEIRVEAEIVRTEKNGKHKEQRIVHNYGHGGAGIGLHWGCAKETAELVLQSLVPQHKL